MAHEEAPDPRRPLDTLYDEKTGSLATYQFEVNTRLSPNIFSVCGNVQYIGLWIGENCQCVLTGSSHVGGCTMYVLL